MRFRRNVSRDNENKKKDRLRKLDLRIKGIATREWLLDDFHSTSKSHIFYDSEYQQKAAEVVCEVNSIKRLGVRE